MVSVKTVPVKGGRMRRGIPTVFRGIRMRSRTEAKVAAFFDELGWVWEYEPDDLLNYIPDFAIHFRTGPVVIEGKALEEDIGLAKSKLEVSGWQREAIVVSREPGGLYGENLVRCDEYVVGNLLESRERTETGPEWHLALLKRCLSCGQITFISDSNSWHCRQCGVNDGSNGGHLGDFDPRQHWATATNRVQWRPAT
jgi:hypothetical protein